MTQNRTDNPAVLLEILNREFGRMYPFSGDFQISLLKISENLTFTVCSAEGKAVLRVDRPTYHSGEELLAELRWMELIRRAGTVPVPRVFSGRDGSPLQAFTSPSGNRYVCSLFSFLPGKAVRQLHGVELTGKISEIGAIAARLHLQACGNPEVRRLRRFCWGLEDMLGPHARWGRWEDYPSLTEQDAALLRRACDRISNMLERYGKTSGRYGMIHADLHLSNVIVAPDGTLQVIDFDDCGFGWFLYDLGCSLVEYSENLGGLSAAWLAGYQTVRPLPREDLAAAPAFLLLRRIVRLAWLGSHSESDTAKTVGPEYLEVTRRLAAEFVGEGEEFPC